MNGLQNKTRNDITLQPKATDPQGMRESGSESPQSAKLRDAITMLRESLTRCDEIIQYQDEIRRICKEFQASKQCQTDSLREGAPCGHEGDTKMRHAPG